MSDGCFGSCWTGTNCMVAIRAGNAIDNSLIVIRAEVCVFRSHLTLQDNNK